MLALGKVRPTSKVVSLDDGATWISVSEVLEQICPENIKSRHDQSINIEPPPRDILQTERSDSSTQPTRSTQSTHKTNRKNGNDEYPVIEAMVDSLIQMHQKPLQLWHKTRSMSTRNFFVSLTIGILLSLCGIFFLLNGLSTGTGYLTIFSAVLLVIGFVFVLVGWLKRKVVTTLKKPKVVTRIGVLNMPIGFLSSGSASVPVDLSGVLEKEVLNFAIIRDPDRFESIVKDIEGLTDSPYIVHPLSDPLKVDAGSVFGCERDMIVKVKSLATELNSSTSQVHLDLGILSRDPVVANLIFGLPDEPNEVAAKVSIQRSVSELANDLLAFEKGVDELKQVETIDQDLIMGQYETRLRSVATRMDEIRRNGAIVASTSSRRAKDCVQLPGNRFYCPVCMQEHIRQAQAMTGLFRYSSHEDSIQAVPDSTFQVLWDNDLRLWTCRICGHATHDPFCFPKIFSDAMHPTFCLMMAEHHAERLSIYSSIQDQKRKYRQEAELEINRIVRENRTICGDIEARIRTHQAKANGCKETLATLAVGLAAFEALQQMRLNDVQNDIQHNLTTIQNYTTMAIHQRKLIIDHQLSTMNTKMNQAAEVTKIERQQEMAIMQTIANNTGSVAKSAERSAISGEQTSASVERSTIANEYVAKAHGFQKSGSA
jgi:hypothetical protein